MSGQTGGNRAVTNMTKSVSQPQYFPFLDIPSMIFWCPSDRIFLAWYSDVHPRENEITLSQEVALRPKTSNPQSRKETIEQNKTEHKLVDIWVVKSFCWTLTGDLWVFQNVTFLRTLPEGWVRRAGACVWGTKGGRWGARGGRRRRRRRRWRRGGRGGGEGVGGGPLEVGSSEILQGDSDFHPLLKNVEISAVQSFEFVTNPHHHHQHYHHQHYHQHHHHFCNFSVNLETDEEAGLLCAGSPCASSGRPEEKDSSFEKGGISKEISWPTFLWKARPQRSQENGL